MTQVVINTNRPQKQRFVLMCFASHTEHMKLWNMHMTCFGPFLTNYVVQKNSQTDSPDSSLINGSHVFDTAIVCLLQIRILYGCTEG